MILSLILCPLDFSAASGPLVAYAATLAAATGAELRLLHVLVAGPALGGNLNPSQAQAEQYLLDHRRAAEQTGARVRTTILAGPPAPTIVAEAHRLGADLLLIGSHGQTGLTRFLMGSTAEKVVRTALCPTLLVNHPTTAAYRQTA